ncbi:MULTISPECIES: BamA/TamA family outer membrane protein [unclassified Kaistella]|uniref:translocation and assembly module lipoprotein TamL n=1 Tax=unclassified Kaistella TaxID=2762626 RepID=UPI0027365968|nr:MULTISPECIES: BamA/TamA family outer membrane protein [unclassified Kaistella]MDP2453929.1 BamA/TamA family outer membrane protein [Kaistella sp. SH11-4b]MDP2456986.1 BamA/TamA family outer membrane protein [Kaistella sp. SH40-3]MDP2459743.1 BamA/TamA family outer membrane protein [Kaistella sp. SH19-2b]
MSGKHFSKYFQKYYLFFSSAITIIFLYACSTTKKVPDGEYLLTKNNFRYEDGKVHEDEIPDYVSQKPNKKQLFLFPLGLWMYNATNPKYDSILAEYMTYPNEMRDQKLRDSLFIKYKHPEYVGKSLFTERFLQNIGQSPVILDQGKTEASANAIRKYLVYKGYWDSDVKFSQDLDSAAKKAQVNYLITHKDPTYISDYYYNIPDSSIKSIYEQNLSKSLVRGKKVLDQEVLEKEVKRIGELMKDNGYYKFNNSNEEIYFTADTLQSRKNVPLTMDIHKDSVDSPYKLTTIGKVKVHLLEKLSDSVDTVKDSLLRINFYKLDDQYKTLALWRPIILRPGEVYDQRNLDLTKRNIAAMNNFSLIKYDEILRKSSDSILDVSYYLAPLPKYDLKVATDLNYSQILNFGVSPSVDLTSRNIFGGAENLTTSLSGTFGSVISSKNTDKRTLAYEISAQASLNFPRLLLPFKTWKIVPKRYSPTSSIILGTTVQDNIGLGRIGFNAGLNYFANANDIVSHRLSVFNTQLSLTQNKDRYYDFFPQDASIRDKIFQTYSPTLWQDFQNNLITSDAFSSQIVNDIPFQQSLAGEQLSDLNTFLQSLINKDRQTQDILISSMIYNFVYNEIGKKDRPNPFYFNGKFEMAGNVFSVFNSRRREDGIVSGPSRTIFSIPYSQFVKFDFDVRKYFTFNNEKQTLALRQFIGIGIPYGNSSTMPFVRSYFNGGSNDIRAWRVFGGLGPADSQLDEKVRSYVMDNVKLTTNIEYRMPFTDMFEGAAFIDAGNIWSLKDSGFGDQFKFNKFLSQMGVGTGLGVRINVAYITLRLDAAYKVYDPNKPTGDRWVISKWQPLKPVLNFAFGYPF